MTITLVYVYPGCSNPAYVDNAARFVHSYHSCPAGIDHESVVVCNACAIDEFVKALFSPLPNLRFIQHDNTGWDIGAFQAAARQLPGRILVFMGSSAWCTRPGWMQRVEQSVAAYGMGEFGSMGNQGDSRVRVSPHLRTTGFWMNAELFNNYPLKVTEPGHRYAFEHGPNCLSEWIKQMGLPRLVVSWIGETVLEHCDGITNGFHRGDQSNLLIRDRLTEPPYYG